MTIVTRSKLIEMINRQDEVAMHAIGRALVHLFRRQTEAERDMNTTCEYNLRGFTGADGRQGALTAKYYLKHKKLLDWQMEIWRKPNKNGIPRLAKYWAQINEEAEKKAKRTA